MEYEGIFACGHKGKIDVTGTPRSKREWIVDKKFEGLCPECYEKMMKVKREKENKEALEKAKEMELPILKGSEKQIAWANTIRQKTIDDIQKSLDEKSFFHENKEGKWIKINNDEIIKIKKYFFYNITLAADWINLRKEDAESIIYKYLKDILK